MSKPRVVQPGAGAVRPLVVMYHLTPTLDHVLKNNVSSGTAIVNVTLAAMKGLYRQTWSENPTLEDLAAQTAKKVGAEGFWPIVLIGFSEGCQGVRQQLPFEPADQTTDRFIAATIAIDGIHSNNKPSAAEEDQQITPWRNWFIRCGALFSVDAAPNVNLPLASVTMSSIKPSTFASVVETIRRITGWAVSAGETRISGNLVVERFSGADKHAHHHQAKVVLGSELLQTAVALGMGPGAPTQTGVTLPTRTRPMGPGTTKDETTIQIEKLSALKRWAPLAGATAWLGFFARAAWRAK